MSWKTQILLLSMWAWAVRDEPKAKRGKISFITFLNVPDNTCICNLVNTTRHCGSISEINFKALKPSCKTKTFQEKTKKIYSSVFKYKSAYVQGAYRNLCRQLTTKKSKLHPSYNTKKEDDK